MSIPKQAFFVYGEHHTNPMRDQGLQNMEDFKRLNPGWNVQLITAENSDTQYLDIYHWSKVAWSQVVRFDLVRRLGGGYSDVDVSFYGPLPAPNGSELIVAIETHRHITDAFFAATPHHPAIEEAFKRALSWCHSKMSQGVSHLRAGDILNEISCGMFGQVVKQHTGLVFFKESQAHMTEHDFAGQFHPENGVGILPFEALCRHNTANWFGWHQCQGSWRPLDEGGVKTTDNEALVEVNREWPLF